MMMQSAPIHAIFVALLATFVPVPLAAQDANAVPMPAEISELETTKTTPWAGPIDSPPAVTDWDLYAGSVYANTSPIWVQAEYLLWWLRGSSLPPLVTTGPPGLDAGALDAPDTQVLFGGQRVDDDARSGFRTSLGVRLGHWFDPFMDSELQFDYLWLGDGQTAGEFQADSFQYAVLARPFFNTETGQQDAQLISYPNVVTGGIAIDRSSDFRSAGVVFRQGWFRGDRGRIEWLAGYRYLQLQEELLANEFQVITGSVNPAVAVGTTFDALDDVSTWNEFHGADLGLQWWTHLHGWTVEVATKVAIGGISRTVNVAGETIIDPPGNSPATIVPGGFLALPTNMGRHHSSCLTAVPELSIKLRRQLSRYLILTCGYSVMVVDDVVRTGDQLDLVINPTQLNGVPRPEVLMNDSQLWLQGFSVGLEW